MASSNNLSVLCQNTTGWSEPKANTLKVIMDTHKIPICCVQEHWQLSKNLFKVEKCFDGYCAFSIPASKKNEHIHRGRPSGGLTILYKNSLERFVTHIQVPNSQRVHGIRVSFPHCAYILINVYFPTDTQRANFNDEILLQTLQDIRFILNSYPDTSNVILCGDINCDFNRDTRFVQIVQNFMLEFDLETLWQKFNIDFTHCQPLADGTFSFSKIDHFLVKNEFLNNCIEGSVLHLGENLSNHEMIFMKVKCDVNCVDKTYQEHFSPSKVIRPNWEKASKSDINNLRDNLNTSIPYINVPNTALGCRDLHCQDDDHRSLLDEYANEILCTLENAVDEYIPTNYKMQQRESIPGWKEYIEPLQDTVNFWKFMWLSCGKPINTQVHFIYRRVRHNYHYAIRNLKRNTQAIKNNVFLKAAANGQINNILKSIRTHRTGKKLNSKVIDNVTGDEPVSEHFSSIYKCIYNKHSPLNFVDLAIDINDSVSAVDTDWLDKITPELVNNLIRKLNSGKNDENFRFQSDAIKYTSDILAGPLCAILKGFLIHGHFTNSFLLCSLNPIVKKNGRSKTDSGNYRLIAILSLLLKLLDLLILHLFSSQLKVDTLQFGFQPGSSTDLCTWTLKESINYFINAGSPVYLCLLDLQKAFDHVRLDLLFLKLKHRLPGMFVRLILYTYLVQGCYVKWNGATSKVFTISNGLRQGAVASPAFFNLYMNDLFKELRNSGIGCQIEKEYFGILGYADDLTLISPSRQGLQMMIDKVKSYCDNHGITISTDPVIAKTKTKVIVYNCKYEVLNCTLYGRDLPTVHKWEHLGHTLTSDESDSYDIIRARATFISDIHSLHQEMGPINPYMFIRLVSIYLTSFYGAPLWDLNSKAAHSLYSTYNYMIRDTFDLPFGTHRYILRKISNLKPLHISLEQRFKRFTENIEKSNRPEVLLLFRKQKFDCRSTFGRNYRNIILSNKNIWAHYAVPENCHWKINLISELINVKNNFLIIKNNISEVRLTKLESDAILQHLCCE